MPRDGRRRDRKRREPHDDGRPIEPPNGEIEHPTDDGDGDTASGHAQPESGQPRDLRVGGRCNLAGTWEHRRNERVPRDEENEGKTDDDRENAQFTERSEHDTGDQHDTRDDGEQIRGQHSVGRYSEIRHTTRSRESNKNT